MATETTIFDPAHALARAFEALRPEDTKDLPHQDSLSAEKEYQELINERQRLIQQIAAMPLDPAVKETIISAIRNAKNISALQSYVASEIRQEVTQEQLETLTTTVQSYDTWTPANRKSLNSFVSNSLLDDPFFRELNPDAKERVVKHVADGLEKDPTAREMLIFKDKHTPDQQKFGQDSHYKIRGELDKLIANPDFTEEEKNALRKANTLFQEGEYAPAGVSVSLRAYREKDISKADFLAQMAQHTKKADGLIQTETRKSLEDLPEILKDTLPRTGDGAINQQHVRDLMRDPKTRDQAAKAINDCPKDANGNFDFGKIKPEDRQAVAVHLARAQRNARLELQAVSEQLVLPEVQRAILTDPDFPSKGSAEEISEYLVKKKIIPHSMEDSAKAIFDTVRKHYPEADLRDTAVAAKLQSPEAAKLFNQDLEASYLSDAALAADIVEDYRTRENKAALKTDAGKAALASAQKNDIVMRALDYNQDGTLQVWEAARELAKLGVTSEAISANPTEAIDIAVGKSLARELKVEAATKEAAQHDQSPNLKLLENPPTSPLAAAQEISSPAMNFTPAPTPQRKLSDYAQAPAL